MPILGGGDRLFGDNGFGCAGADNVYVMDIGMGARKLLFTPRLSQERPQRIVILDAVGKVPGEVFELSLGDVPREKIDGFSLHQVPSSNATKDLTGWVGASR